MSNPVVNRFGESGGPNRGPQQPTPSAGQLNDMFAKPAYTGPHPTDRVMTLDDVVQRTAAMLGTILLAGAVSWVALPDRLYTPVLIVALMGSLGLGLFMAFTQRVNAVGAIVYSVFEGVLLGAISRVFEQRYDGIVIQAVTGTVMVALGMLFVYKIGAIRVTPRFTRIVAGATIGVFGLMLVNLVAYLFTPGGLHLRDGGPFAVIFSLICIGVAAFNLAIDFEVIQQGIRRGAPQKFAWYASFGLVLTLVWLYIEILRLLGYARR